MNIYFIAILYFSATTVTLDWWWAVSAVQRKYSYNGERFTHVSVLIMIQSISDWDYFPALIIFIQIYHKDVNIFFLISNFA